jgi:hypothetical protein
MLILTTNNNNKTRTHSNSNSNKDRTNNNSMINKDMTNSTKKQIKIKNKGNLKIKEIHI